MTNSNTMTGADPDFLTVRGSDGTTRRIAYLSTPGGDTDLPGMVWFCGFNSVMTGTKASALAAWAEQFGYPMIRFDYSGHGQSDGDFTDGTIGQWLEESIAILSEVARGPQILVGSSMGAWMVLLILRAVAERDPVVMDVPEIKAAVMIAPAWDMTEKLFWDEFNDEMRATMAFEGQVERPSRYGEDAYIITQKLIDEGRNHLLGGKRFTPGCPIRILHGLQDPDVPWRHANELVNMLDGLNVATIFIAKGDHRLSRPEDIQKLFRVLDDLYRDFGSVEL